MVESRCGLICNECSYKEPCNCKGCLNFKNPFWGVCKVKACCEDKNLLHCGECKGFPCTSLVEFSHDKEHGDNGARIDNCKQWKNKTIVEMSEKIVKESNTASIAVVREDGYPIVSTISNIRVNGIKTIWFATSLNSNKVRCLLKNSKASICYTSDGNNVTLIGEVEVLRDASTRKELWVDWFIEHFPMGADDPTYCILKFNSELCIYYLDSKYYGKFEITE